jgi:integrase
MRLARPSMFGPSDEGGKGQAAVERIEDDLTPNSCRHTGASWQVNKNKADVLALQRMMGHANPSITLHVYLDLWDERAKELAADMDETFGVIRSFDSRARSLPSHPR